MYRVHAVIVTHNSADEIDQCLRTLYAQEGVRISTTVVDNASTDATVELIREHHPSVGLICLQTNVGFARANNVALHKKTSTDIWMLLNPDTYFTDSRTLEALSSHLMTSPRVGAVGCRLVRADGSLDHAGKRGIPTPWSAMSYLLGLHRVFPHDRRFSSYIAGHIPDDIGPVTVECINGAFMLLRPDAIHDTGGFDERFFMYAEDIDLCLRLRQHDWSILYDPDVTLVHLKGASAGGIGFHRRNGVAFVKSMTSFYGKHYAAEYPFLLSVLVLVTLRTIELGVRVSSRIP